jgi:alpha-glucosidase
LAYLNEINNPICRKYAKLHVKMGDYILQLARKAAETGELIVRHLEYEFPYQGFENCKDQFMLGDKYLVAPMVKQGTARTVVLPEERWKDDSGKKWKGVQTIRIDVPLDRLPYFERL